MKETDVFAYMMAAEKVIAMISTIDNTLEFFEEYGIKPDEEVKKALNPIIERMKTWVKNES
jgi:hypothetical protein